MKRLLIIAACALTCACTTPATLQPATYASATLADDKSANTAEYAYQAWRVAVKAALNAGLHGPAAAKVAKIDNQLYAALSAVEAAYASANSTSIATAVGNFNSVLTAGYSALHGGQ